MDCFEDEEKLMVRSVKDHAKAGYMQYVIQCMLWVLSKMWNHDASIKVYEVSSCLYY